MSFTALQLDSGAGLLNNQGLATNVAFTTAVTTYNSNSLIDPLIQTIETGSANILSNVTLVTLSTLASNSCPALSDSVPAGYVTLVVANNPAGFTGLLTNTANTYMGNGDLSVFCQALSVSQSYIDQTNLFVNSAVNSQSYLGNTFKGINSMITGAITDVNLATDAFATDLSKLGRLINLADLNNFGSPLALIRQLNAVSGIMAITAVTFVDSGVPQEVVVNLTSPTLSVTDSVQRLMYEAMTKITQNNLAQILSVLGVTTPGIMTMADLLNPLLLFPQSFASLTAPTEYGPRAIYVNSTGSVNQNLIRQLPPYVISSLI